MTSNIALLFMYLLLFGCIMKKQLIKEQVMKRTTMGVCGVLEGRMGRAK